MEQAMQKGPAAEESTFFQDSSSMSFESFSDIPEELGIFPPSEEVIVNLVDIYFRLLQDIFHLFA